MAQIIITEKPFRMKCFAKTIQNFNSSIRDRKNIGAKFKSDKNVYLVFLKWSQSLLQEMKTDNAEQDPHKTFEKGILQKLYILDTALSTGDSEQWQQLLHKTPAFLIALQERMLSQDLPDEYFGLARKVFERLSDTLSLNHEREELSLFQLQLALIFLKLDLYQPKWYCQKGHLKVSFSRVIDDLLSNSTTINHILLSGNVSQDQRYCRCCQSPECTLQIYQLVNMSLIHLFEVLNQILSSGLVEPLCQKLLTFAYFGLDTKVQSVVSGARTLATSLFELLPPSRSEIMWRTIYSFFDTIEMLNRGPISKHDSSYGRIREEIASVLRLLNISGCYACNSRRRSQPDAAIQGGCCLLKLKTVDSDEMMEVFCHTELTRNCDILVSYLYELMKKEYWSSKKKVILNCVESILALFPDLLFPSAFFVVASLFHWCLESLKICTENSQMRLIAFEVLTKVSIRLLEIRREHKQCNLCCLITERDRTFVTVDANTSYFEQLAPHSLGCWMTVLSRVSKKVNIIFEERVKDEATSLSNAVKLSLKEVAQCSAASCSLTKAGPCQAIELLFSVLSVGSQQERQRVIQCIKYILKADPNFFSELKWVESALILLSRDPAASVRAVAVEVGLHFTSVRHMSENKLDFSKSVVTWTDIVIERLRDSNPSVRKTAIGFAKVLLAVCNSANAASGTLLIQKNLFRYVILRLEDEETGVREACMDCLEEYLQSIETKLSVSVGSSYELAKVYHDIFESLNSLKSDASRTLLFHVVSKVNVGNVSLLVSFFFTDLLKEKLIKYSMNIVATTFQNVCHNKEYSEAQVDEHYHLATLFLETACQWDPECTAPYERYLLSCLELSMKSRDIGVHVVSNVIVLLSRLYESTPAGLEGAKKFLSYLESILTNNLCPVLGNAVIKSLHRLYKIPTFRIEIQEILHELLAIAKKQTSEWQATTDTCDSQENTWKIISTIFVRIASLSNCTTSKCERDAVRMAMFWFLDRVFCFMKHRLQSTSPFDVAWFSVAMEAALIYMKCDCSYLSTLGECLVLLLRSDIVAEGQKISLLYNLQNIISEGIRELQSDLNEDVDCSSGTDFVFLSEANHSIIDSVSVVVQHILDVLLNLIFSSNILIRKHVCSIICQCICSGILVPIEVLPTLFCFILEKESQPDIGERAMATLKFIAKSQQEMIGSRLVEGLYRAWKFWRVTLNSDWNCLVEEGSHGFLQSRFAVIFGLLSSTQLFEFFRTVLDEIISSEEGWLFCIFCAVPLLFLDPSSIVAMKGQRKRPLNILEEMKVIADKCMQLVATFDSDYLEDCGGTENCSEDCANSIRLYLIALIHDKFLLLIQTWNRNDGMHDDVFIAKHREYWNEITKLGKDPSHNYIKLRIRSLMEVSISTKKRELLSTANDRMTKVSWTRRTFVFLSGMERQIPRDENDMYVV